ncbi:HdeD family acid-resistance protein [Tetragenococcus halophilus]|uniref:HdeD family acid-resistance protein n=1 Tax=Tetragenococcus halophilus TaxID=51669 RepID=UPI0025628FE9|nr:DUF308 domain-containing protein [Tetragenococcus halophilus]GMG67258.1 DUF308 domain-containing protein [Tetragenococcus halophilus]
MNERKSVNWGGLILGILFLLIALLAFNNPAGSLSAIVIFFAILAIINGIFSIVVRNQIKNMTGFRATAFLILGTIELILGIILLFNLSAGVIALSYVFAVWFIADSVRNLFFLDHARTFGNGHYWLTLFINIIGIIVGLMLFFDPIVSALTISFLVGLYFILIGIFYIVNSLDH